MNNLGSLLARSHVEHKARSKSVEPIASEVLSVSAKEKGDNGGCEVSQRCALFTNNQTNKQ